MGDSRASDNTHVCQAHPRHHLHRETRRPPRASASMPACPFLPAHRDSASAGLIVPCAQLASRASARQGQRGPRNVIRKKPTQNADSKLPQPDLFVQSRWPLSFRRRHSCRGDSFRRSSSWGGCSRLCGRETSRGGRCFGSITSCSLCSGGRRSLGL